MTLNSFLTLAGSIGLVTWAFGAAAMLRLIVRVSGQAGISALRGVNLLQTIGCVLFWPFLTIVTYFDESEWREIE